MDGLRNATEAAQECVRLADKVIAAAKLGVPVAAARHAKQLPSAIITAEAKVTPLVEAFRLSLTEQRPTLYGESARSYHELAILFALPRRRH